VTPQSNEQGDKSVTHGRSTRKPWRYRSGHSFFADLLVIGLVLGACYVVGTVLQEALSLLGIDLFP
jgi:hypothetical protein